MTSRTLNYILIACSLLFFTLFVTTVFVYANLQKFVNQQIVEQSPLVKGSDSIEKWSNPSDDTLFVFSFYFFNITNPEEVLKGEKPILSETGPYRFNEKRIYEILSWEDNEELLNFKYKKNFFHDSENFGNADDKITTLNVPLITTYNIVKMMKLSPLIKWSIITLLNRLPLITTQKATDLLFGGYKDGLTTFIAEIEQILKLFKINIKLPPSISSSGQFALMANRNNTDYGLWTIFTGKNHLENLGKMLYLDGLDNIPCWAKKCNRLMGSDGLLYKPFVKNDDILSVFELELNRTVDLVFEKDTTYEGLPTKKFVLSEMTYASPIEYPENKCFYPTKDEFNDMSGILYTQHCNLEVPLAFSNPHFYLADKYFLNQFDGLNPVKNIHESFIYVNQDLGINLRGRQAVQLNIDTNSVPAKRGLQRYVFPIFWIDESGFAGKTLIDHINEKLYSKVEKIKIYLVFGSFFLFVLFITPLNYVIIELIFKWKNNGNDTESIISNETDQNNSENEVNDDSDSSVKDEKPDIKHNDSAISV